MDEKRYNSADVTGRIAAICNSNPYPQTNGSTAIDTIGESDNMDSAVDTMDIDSKIKELEAETERLQPLVQRLGLIAAQLDTLRKAKSLLTDGDGNGNGVAPIGSRIVPGSIGALALEVLRQAARPVHVKEILEQVRAKGKPNLAEATLVSTLCGYMNSGKIKRPAPSTYAL
jgi:hypothetical protein